MDPALRARIRSSVRGRRGDGGVSRGGKGHDGGTSPLLVSFLRLGFVAAVLGLTGWLGWMRHREGQELERERAALLDALHVQSASWSAEDRAALGQAKGWLGRLSAPYDGDLVTEELKTKGGLAAALGRPAVFARTPLVAWKSDATAADAVSASVKDALLFCLLEPPTSRNEKVLLAKVRSAYSGGPFLEQHSSNVRTLHEEELGLQVLSRAWEARIEAAREVGELGALKKELVEARVDRAKAAAKAELLVAAIDEPGEQGAASELDGEKKHPVRVALVELATGRLLFRARTVVDPSSWSATARSQYAGGLDSCALALDVASGAGP